jgi:hypothetical protein
MNTQVTKIQQAISPIRESLTNHAVYQRISQIDHLQVFMQDHIFAVWDFMSILKALQRNLTCVELPWIPVGSAQTRYLINEIVNGEESDVDEVGNRMSHFELYLDAMSQADADLEQIKEFLNLITQKVSVNDALVKVGVSDSVRDFVNFTFEVIATNQPHIQAAVFTFGREDLIPDMFIAMVKDLNASMPEKISKFTYYLERHIEVDGDHHSHLALQMVEELCGNDATKWQEAIDYSVKALEMRKKLWDGVEEKVQKLALSEVNS